MPDMPDTPALADVHHLKLPVRDLARSGEWFTSRLGYEIVAEFIEGGKLVAYGLYHPRGGPPFGLWLDPVRAEATAGFDYFAIGVADKSAIDELAERLTALGVAHDGVEFALLGWALRVYDPDGHEIRFYTHEHHYSEDIKGPREIIRDFRKTARQREQVYNNARAQAAVTVQGDRAT